MHQAHENSKKEAFLNKFASFLTANRLVLGIILGTLLVALVSAVIFKELQEKNDDKIIVSIEEWEIEYLSLKDGSDKEAELTAILEKVEEFIEDNNPKRFVGQKTYKLKGDIAYDLKQWSLAAEAYETGAKIQESYLSVILLSNSAVANENNGDLGKALTQLNELIEMAPKSAEAPRAYFNVGRLLEAQEKNEEALEQYRKLELDFPTSDWTKLAKERIIELK